jgi:hypothetical protein
MEIAYGVLFFIFGLTKKKMAYMKMQEIIMIINLMLINTKVETKKTNEI